MNSTILRTALIATVTAAGCATRPEGPPPGTTALPWGAVDPGAGLDDNMRRRLAEAFSADREAGPSYPVLVLTGAGSRSAFGAGLLCGWTQAGTRPEFQVVSGTSTGALLAVFAFLGTEYDEVLEAQFTGTSTRDVYRRLGFITSEMRGAVNGAAPLRENLEAVIDEALLDAVASEHAAGRRLYAATSNLDSGRSVLWDMGAIAASDRPDRAERFREVLLASMSTPVLLPPVFFEIEVDGEQYWQMHADGAFAAPIIPGGLMIELAEMAERSGVGADDVRARLYVIISDTINSRGPGAGATKPHMRDIAVAAIEALFAAARDRSLYAVEILSHTKAIELNYAVIPDDFPDTPRPQIYNEERMRKLFDFAREQALAEYGWRRRSPAYRRWRPNER